MAEPLGLRLKAIREFYGWSQRELAKRAGVPNSAISVIEQGSVSPSVSSLERVLKGFPITLTDFFAISMNRQLAKVSHEDHEQGTGSFFAAYQGNTGRELTLRSFKCRPDDPVVNLMSRGQTMILLVAGEAQYHALGVEHHLVSGSSLSLQSPTPFRLEPIGGPAEWVVASIS